MHTLNHIRLVALLCLATAALTGCRKRQNSYTPDQQKQMKSGQPPQITADQRAQMEAALARAYGKPAVQPLRIGRGIARNDQ